MTRPCAPSYQVWRIKSGSGNRASSLMLAAAHTQAGGMSRVDALAAVPPPALQVVEWLLSGASESQVAEALAAKYPSACPEQTMAEVRLQLSAAGNPDASAVRGWALLAYRNIYRKMLEVGDFDGARKVIKEITGLAAV